MFQINQQLTAIHSDYLKAVDICVNPLLLHETGTLHRVIYLFWVAVFFSCDIMSIYKMLNLAIIIFYS